MGRPSFPHQHFRSFNRALTPEKALSFARHTMGLDFLAITDAVSDIRRLEWTSLVEAIRRYTQDGEFAAFAGFEFYSTEKEGKLLQRLDRNVIYRDPDSAQLPEGKGLEDYYPQDSEALLSKVDPAWALIIPHQHP